ncbi:hypothetical protein [Neomoorella thermoacetica]|uniref:Uncharacterized protein n=2 Tax=Neomoorella thermoacetica TaxID=1525 RepID=A0A1D7XC34_NEOTH|nr:hypothetical protein [Moorella thermoacetica]AKX94514.1 hypothetical protein MOTHE_c17210 [Moorella thermoacetica]AKX97150.1 hypothetical protein MOTHA_c18040 [Moorella thermoacetica]AOQ24439.1 hypothetical protein Maut_02004 [Moorella thermoacetica]APC08904.1 hypothetical protein MTJW_17450 [Moorella thermoacetica]OIQ09570.1 hypothetical protein MOOR_09550 [Moorella thermoacetica]
MSQVLARTEYGKVLPELTPAELNAAYARLEERYNCLRSNWEWFTKAGYSRVVADPAGRVEQN